MIIAIRLGSDLTPIPIIFNMVLSLATKEVPVAVTVAPTVAPMTSEPA